MSEATLFEYALTWQVMYIRPAFNMVEPESTFVQRRDAFKQLGHNGFECFGGVAPTGMVYNCTLASP